MSRRSRKAEVRAFLDTEERRVAVARVRHPHEDVGYLGAGLLMVQLLTCPSFERTVSWEVRLHGKELGLYRSMSPEPDQYKLIGHERFQASTEALQSIIAPLERLVLPCSLREWPPLVADGTRIELFVGVSGLAGMRLNWSEGCAPEEWAILDTVVREMRIGFEAFPPVEMPEAGSGRT